VSPSAEVTIDNLVANRMIIRNRLVPKRMTLTFV